MKWQHVSEENYLDYLSGEITAERQKELEAHLQECAECCENVEQYEEILRNGLPFMPSNPDLVACRPETGALWFMEEGKGKLISAAQGQEATNSGAESGILADGARRTDAPQRKFFVSPASLPLAIAATVILFVGVGSAYYFDAANRQSSSLAERQLSSIQASSHAQFETVTAEKNAMQAKLTQEDDAIVNLRAEIAEKQRQIDVLKLTSQSEKQQLRVENNVLSLQRDGQANTIQTQQASLGAAHARLDALEQAANRDIIRSNALENQVHQASESLKEKEATIGKQEQMLAADRDIRELMGERELLMAEVYDVGASGKKNKPYGRVFYTKGKSLIFYAYDLDQTPGMKHPGIFQAWGMRGPDRNNALNLGVMYVDNLANKRWALRFDDQQSLQQINAVFVTVEPNGESRAPRGKQVLFAFLDETPNHP